MSRLTSGTVRRLHHDEEGAVAATTAVMMLALIGVVMLAIDGGGLWTSRRNVITDTDAAALAAASVLVEGRCTGTAQADAEDEAIAILAANDVNVTTDGDPAIVCSGRAGRVSVAAIRTTQLTFGGLAGIPEVDVASTSIVQFGHIVSATGLRPIAICNKDPHVIEVVRESQGWSWDDVEDRYGAEARTLAELVEANPLEHPLVGPDGFYTGEVHRIYFTRESLAPGCGDASGNWGWLDFAGNGNSAGNADVRDWIEFGFPGAISVGPDEDCAPETNAERDCMGESGAGGNSWNNALEAMYCDSTLTASECINAGKSFPIIVFDRVVCNGGGRDGCAGSGGANARYDHEAFIGVILRDWSGVTGNPGIASYFDFEFIDDYILEGTLSSSPPADSSLGVMGIQLCGGGYGPTIDDFCTIP